MAAGAISAGDSGGLACQKLSAPHPLAAIEARRLAAEITQADLARAAGIPLRTFMRMLAGRSPVSATRLDRLARALDRLARKARSPLGVGETTLVRATLAGSMALMAPYSGLSAGEVAAALAGGEERTADPAWRRASHVRQAAIYVTNTVLGLPQRRLAEALDLTPAAVCLALQAVEDRRDDPDFDGVLTKAAAILTGERE